MWRLTPVISAIWEVEMGRIEVLSQPPGKRLARPHLNKKTRDLAYIYSLSYKGAVGRKRSKVEWEKEKKKKERETLCEK
jgi:hypothetical protein